MTPTTTASASRSTGTVSFSGHETFVCRHGWLKKALDEVVRDPAFFSSDDAMVALGVGKNMVRSIRHWALATRVLEEVPNTRGAQLHPTIIGAFLFGEGGKDPYLEDPSSLWLLHWHLVTNERRATTWAWAFNLVRSHSFTRDTLLGVILEELRRRSIAPPSEHSLRRDIDCFIRTYLRTRDAAVAEDALECPLTELDVLRQDETGVVVEFVPGFHETLGNAAFVYALLQFWESRAPGRETLPFSDIAYGVGSPGAVFKLDENSLAARLEALEHITGGRLVYTDTAGIRQVYQHGGLFPGLHLLQEYYEQHDPRGEADV